MYRHIMNTFGGFHHGFAHRTPKLPDLHIAAHTKLLNRCMRYILKQQFLDLGFWV